MRQIENESEKFDLFLRPEDFALLIGENHLIPSIPRAFMNSIFSVSVNRILETSKTWDSKKAAEQHNTLRALPVYPVLEDEKLKALDKKIGQTENCIENPHD